MITSEHLSELAKALCKAQAAIMGAQKDSKNPHFNSKFSSLASVWDACREQLTSNGLSIVQALNSVDNKVNCTTMLLHTSGQYIRTDFAMTPQQNTPQAAGSCATYLRRYSLQSLVGVCSEDDDAHAATHKEIYANTPNTTQNIVVKPLVKNAVAGPNPSNTPNSPAVAVFSKGNATQIKILGNFLAAKNQMSLFDALANRLENKPFTQTNIAKEWEIIGPECFNDPNSIK